MQLDSGSKRSALVCRFANEDGKTAKSVRDAAGSLTKSSRGSSAGFTSLSAALISNRGDNQGLPLCRLKFSIDAAEKIGW